MSKPLSAEARRFDQTVGDLTASLGDPTRRAIYIAVREAPEPLTTSAVAEFFQIHPNVARHHLDRLVADGYLRVTHRQPGEGAGRPANCFVATTKPIDLHFPVLRNDLLVGLLIAIIDRIAPENVAAVAEKVGRDHGRELAAEIGDPRQAGYEEAVRAVAWAMTGLGFHMSPDPDGQRLLTSYCPFGDNAVGHRDVVCSLDQGLVAGMLEALHQECEPILFPRSGPVEDCITEVPVMISSRPR